jgi:hypothetical protein
MTRTAARKKPKRHPVRARRPPRKPITDRAVYIGIVVVGLFIVLLGALFAGPEIWPAILVGYLAMVAWHINASAFRAYRGRSLADWQQSLARIPLRPVGYGTREGKPIEAAHDHPETLKAVRISIAVSVAIVAAAAVFAWRMM